MTDAIQTPQEDPPLITPTADPALASVVESIEKDLLIVIMQAVKKDEMTTDDAQKLAEEFMTLLPINNKQELLNKLSTLGEENKQAKYVYNKYVATLDEEKRQQTLETMREHIQNGSIDKALQVAKDSYGK